MDINELTIGQGKELAAMFGGNAGASDIIIRGIDDFANNQIVIVRTYSAGVWAGKLVKKHRDEVILENARRMWRWWCAESISLSAVALHGINRDKSRIAGPIRHVWLQPIEIIPFCNAQAEKSVMESSHAVAE